MLSTIPFGGFYNSLHDDNLDDALNQMFSDDQGTTNEGLVNRVLDKCQWGLVHANYAQAYAESLANELKVKFEFESLSSPREYNFQTDRIFVKIEQSEVERIKAETDPTEFVKVAESLFTSCDGFISGYSPDVADWGPVADWDHNQVGCLLLAYTLQEIGDFDQFKENDLMENARCNGHFESWICSATDDINRYYRVSEWLNSRKK